MPELPEVEAIAQVVRRHSLLGRLSAVDVVRQNGKYFRDGLPEVDRRISSVHRVGKYIQIGFDRGPYTIVHNAMSGYFDWEHEPWTFDYVEGERTPGESDVRVRFTFADGRVLRFHDTRCFGFMFESDLGAPVDGPELMVTPMCAPGLKVITLSQFARGVYSSSKPIKTLLMDQSFVSGIGNIYANEGLHLAGIDPRNISNTIYPKQIPLLLDSLRLLVERQIPTISYNWLEVYRRTKCGSCGSKILKDSVDGRSTFICETCQL